MSCPGSWPFFRRTVYIISVSAPPRIDSMLTSSNSEVCAMSTSWIASV
jgi:hypothetical protein